METVTKPDYSKNKQRPFVVISGKSNMKKKKKTISFSDQLLQWKQTKFTYFPLSTTVSNAGSFSDFSAISPGTGQDQRIGSSIQHLKFRMRGQITLADTTNLFRLLTFVWHVDNTSDNPQAAEILMDSSNPLSGFIHYVPKRFTILTDNLWSLDAYHPTAAFDIDVPVKKLRSTFTSGNTGQGHIYVFALSDSSGIPHPALNMEVEKYWKDTE